MTKQQSATMGTKSKYPMVSVEEAQSAISCALGTLPIEEVALSDAHGRVLRADVHAPHDLPLFTASLKDGYAVSSGGGEAGKQLRIRADLASHASLGGATDVEALGEGEAAYVATGAPLPPGSDAVAMIEVCHVENEFVTLSEWPDAGRDVRGVGSDAHGGELLLQSGCVLRAGEIGLLACAGVKVVSVTKQVRVGVLSSGDELSESASNERGGVYDANRPMLLGLLTERCGGFAVGVDLGVVRDDVSAVEEKLTYARDNLDVLVTTGGVSMGARDYIKPMMEKCAKMHFGRVNMKPGKPLAFATFDEGGCVVALPGNPVSAFVCFHVAAMRAIRVLTGVQDEVKTVGVKLSHDFGRDRIRPEFHRVMLKWDKGEYVATSTGKQDSSRLLSVRHADAFVLIQPGGTPLTSGTIVNAQLLR